jgi:hypothetical protein
MLRLHNGCYVAFDVCRYDFDIPILAMDLVAAGGAVTLAIIDACPVTSRLTLPQHYVQTMAELQANFLPGRRRFTLLCQVCKMCYNVL